MGNGRVRIRFLRVSPDFCWFNICFMRVLCLLLYILFTVNSYAQYNNVYDAACADFNRLLEVFYNFQQIKHEMKRYTIV